MFARFQSFRFPQGGRFLLRLYRESDGSTAVEYAVTLALISVAMLASVLAVGSSSAELFNSLARELKSADEGSVIAPSSPAPSPKPATPNGGIKVTAPGSVATPSPIGAK